MSAVPTTPKLPKYETVKVSPREEGTSAAQELIRIGVDQSQLFHDDRGEAHAVIGNGAERRIVPVKSGAYSRFLAGKFWEARGKPANGEAIGSARNVLAYKAGAGPRHPLNNRFAYHEGAVWIDLASDKGEAVKVTPYTWTIETPPILFRRFRAQAPLPTPDDSGDIRRLTDFINIKSKSDALLSIAWIVTAVLGSMPRPILGLHGAQGAAKTTTAKMFRRLTDPSAAGTNRLSGKDDELALTLETNAVLLFDNLTKISVSTAETLCQAVTGGGFTKRELYSDSDEVVYDFRRAIIVTGINIATAAPDLLDRFLLVSLARVSREQRRPEAAIWRAFDTAAPALFGGLLNALSGAMKVHPETEEKVQTLERMADFTLWGASVAEALGYGRDAFLKAYAENVGRQTEEVLEADPVARAVRELAEKGGFVGTPSALLKLLKDRNPNEIKSFPERADYLSRRLNVLFSTLADVGVLIEWDRSAAQRTVRISAAPVSLGNSSSLASQRHGTAPGDANDASDDEYGTVTRDDEESEEVAV